MATVRDILAEMIPRLAAVEIDTPRLDAEVLLAHALGVTRGWLWAHPERVLTAEEATRFHALCARRSRREPLAYLQAEWEFYGRTFHVSPDVLVPRPETELLVEAVLAWTRAHHATTVADIGAGSGAIAVTLAAEQPALRVIAVDLSPGALEVARANAVRHGVSDRVTFLAGDLLHPLRVAGLPLLDAIVANLPYITDEEYAGLMPEVRNYEPALALRGGEDGLVLIRRLIHDAPSRLVPGGFLGLEVGQGQAETVAAVLRSAGWREVHIIADYAGIPRHVIAILSRD